MMQDKVKTKETITMVKNGVEVINIVDGQQSSPKNKQPPPKQAE